MAGTTVILEGKNPMETLDIVRELRTLGMIQGRDFDFKYEPAQYDGWHPKNGKRALFIFYQEKHATYFTLKYL